MLGNLYGKRLGSKIFSSQTFPRINTPTFLSPVILHTYLHMKMGQSVPKRQHIKFRRRGITQNKAYKNAKFLVALIYSLTNVPYYYYYYYYY